MDTKHWQSKRSRFLNAFAVRFYEQIPQPITACGGVWLSRQVQCTPKEATKPYAAVMADGLLTMVRESLPAVAQPVFAVGQYRARGRSGLLIGGAVMWSQAAGLKNPITLLVCFREETAPEAVRRVAGKVARDQRLAWRH